MVIETFISRDAIFVLKIEPTNHFKLSSPYVKRIGLHMKKINSKVVLGNGLEVEMYINVNVEIQQCQSQVSCLVIKLSDGFDIILEIIG